MLLSVLVLPQNHETAIVQGRRARGALSTIGTIAPDILAKGIAVTCGPGTRQRSYSQFSSAKIHAFMRENAMIIMARQAQEAVSHSEKVGGVVVGALVLL